MENIPDSTPATEPSGKTAISPIVCGAYFLNHFQSSMLGVLYPLIMRDLAIGFVAIGAITAVYGFVGKFLSNEPRSNPKNEARAHASECLQTNSLNFFMGD